MTDNFSMDGLEDRRLATFRLKMVTHLFSLLTVAGLTAGVYAGMVGHDFAYGTYREVPWGVVISSFAFFANAAIGVCILAAIGNAYGVTTLAPLANRAVYFSIVLTVAAFMLFAFGIENPWRFLLYNATSPNLTSNIWWMVTLFGIMGGCLFLRFAFMLSDRPGLAANFGIIAAVAGIGANNNIGGLFTIASDPPIWYGFQLILHFLAMAVLSGTAVIICVTWIAFKIRGVRLDATTRRALHSAATILALVLACILVISVSRYTAMFFTDEPEPGQIALLAVIQGPLAFNFWLFEMLIGLVIPLVLLVVTRIEKSGPMVLAAFMALIGSYWQRFDLVITGQIVPKFSTWTGGEVEYLGYMPTTAEFIIVAGAFSFTALGFMLGERFIGRLFRFRV